MSIRLERDSQQWVLNRLIQETGKVFHFQGPDHGGLPRSVQQHDMISKHVGKAALRLRRLAEEEVRSEHPETALEFFFGAATMFAAAQHTIFETNREKVGLHGLSIDCFDRVRELAPYPIERVEIPWGDGWVYGNLHLLPDRRKAPCVIFVPGCDMTKEMYPFPHANHAHQRGMHVIAIDGPGQGESNIDGTKLTADNYERAVSRVVDYLETRAEIDSEAIGIVGHSFGSFWSFRATAHEPRLRAHAGMWASIADKHALMDVESPRWKQLFAYLTGATSEKELDAVTAQMTTCEQAPLIRCPTLLTVGEYDPRSPLREVVGIFETMQCERQLWVLEDQHHQNTISGSGRMTDSTVWNHDAYLWALDFVRDRLRGRPLEHSGEVLYLRSGATGPHGPDVRLARSWIDLVPEFNDVAIPVDQPARRA